MKTGGNTFALLLLSAFLVSGCAATVAPPLTEQEEEFTQEKMAVQEEESWPSKIDWHEYEDGGNDAD
jgi:hypothetical protein